MLVQRDRRQRTDIAVEDGSTRTSTVATPVRGIREIRGAPAHPAHAAVMDQSFLVHLVHRYCQRTLCGAFLAFLGFCPTGD